MTATGTTVGTAAYLSPEQATGSALGPESDIYSLGLVLLECLTGTLEYPAALLTAMTAMDAAACGSRLGRLLGFSKVGEQHWGRSDPGSD